MNRLGEAHHACLRVAATGQSHHIKFKSSVKMKTDAAVQRFRQPGKQIPVISTKKSINHLALSMWSFGCSRWFSDELEILTLMQKKSGRKKIVVEKIDFENGGSVRFFIFLQISDLQWGL